MNKKLCALMLSAMFLLTSCASSKSGVSRIEDKSQAGSAETDKSAAPSEPEEKPVTNDHEPEAAQSEYPPKTLQIYNGIDIVREYEITSESPLWYIGEEITTVDEMIDEEPDIVYMGARGWLLQYEDFLLFSYDMEYNSARVTTVSPYTGCDLFEGYRMGYLRLSELKELLGNYNVTENEATGYQMLSSVFRFKEYPQDYYSMVFSFENGYDNERCTMLTTYVSSEPIEYNNYYDDYYDDSYYYDDYSDVAETELPDTWASEPEVLDDTPIYLELKSSQDYYYVYEPCNSGTPFEYYYIDNLKALYYSGEKSCWLGYAKPTGEYYYTEIKPGTHSIHQPLFINAPIYHVLSYSEISEQYGEDFMCDDYWKFIWGEDSNE